MASHWMREVKFTEVSGTSTRNNAAKFIYLFLRYVLGYTHVSESAASGRSFQTYEKTGTAGSFTGSSFRFTDLSSSFVVGDVNKWVLLFDTTNPENSGWYQIVTFIDVDNVDINFKTGITEYPTSSSGLTWYVMAEDYDIPMTVTDWWRLRTPHADGWEVELQFLDFYSGGVDWRVFRIRVSIDQDWTAGGKILGPMVGCWGLKTNTALGSTLQYVEGDTDGSYVHFINLYSTTSFMGAMCSIVPVTPLEDVPAHAADEKIALVGGISLDSVYRGFSSVENAIIRQNAANSIEGWDASYWGNLYVWRNAGARKVQGGIVYLSWNNPDVSFTGLATRQSNSRRGGNDTLLGSPAIIDYHNRYNQYEICILGGHETIRANLPGMQVIDQSGTKDKIHVGGGVLLPWPGFTPTFTG